MGSSSGKSGKSRNRRSSSSSSNSSRSGRSLCADRNSFFDEDMCDCDMKDSDEDACQILWDEVCDPNDLPGLNTLEFCQCLGIYDCRKSIEEEVVDVVQMNLRGNAAAE